VAIRNVKLPGRDAFSKIKVPGHLANKSHLKKMSLNNNI
jgi:hypothetical protein